MKRDEEGERKFERSDASMANGRNQGAKKLAGSTEEMRILI